MNKSSLTALVLMLMLVSVVVLAQPVASVGLPGDPSDPGLVATAKDVSGTARDADGTMVSTVTREPVSVPSQVYGSGHIPWSLGSTSPVRLSETEAEEPHDPALDEYWAKIGTAEPVGGERPAADTCAISDTGPVFWDMPPSSGSTVCTQDGCILTPGPDDEVRVIIQLQDEPVAAWKFALKPRDRAMSIAQAGQVRSYAEAVRDTQQQVIAQIRAQETELKVHRQFDYLFNGVAASVKQGDIDQIASLPRVKAVHLDYQVHALLDESVPLIGADEVWEMTDKEERPVTGKGIRVAILDTGIDYTHPDLGGCFGSGCKVVDGYDFVNEDGDPMDDHGHGTHVAGIVAANGMLKGVAPDATLLAYKVLDESGIGRAADVIAAIEAATDPDAAPSTPGSADVINLSLSSDNAPTPEDPLAMAVDAAVRAGVVVVVSAGNQGPDCETIRSPGVAPLALTVGSTDKSDNMARSSSRGPIAGFYKLIKPDILAPGVHIISTAVAGEYRRMSGTSMAAPHVAGAAALIKQMYPGWDPLVIKANLMNSAADLGLDVYAQGAGRLQANDSVSAPALLVPSSTGFGRVDLRHPIWTETNELQFTGLVTQTVTYHLAVSQTFPVGITVSVSPTHVTLEPAQSISVTVTVTVDNNLAPCPSEPPYAYQGRVVATAVSSSVTTSALTVPFAFIRSPQLLFTFEEDPWIVLIHDGKKIHRTYYDPKQTLSVLVPAGTYDAWIIYASYRTDGRASDPQIGDTETWVVREGIVVTETTHLWLALSSAEHTAVIAPVDKNGQAIVGRGGSFAQQLVHRPSGLQIGIVGGLDLPLQQHFSDVSENYSWTWRADTAWNEDWYEFNDRAIGISGNLEYVNDMDSLRQVTYQFEHVASGSEVIVSPWVAMKTPWDPG